VNPPGCATGVTKISFMDHKINKNRLPQQRPLSGRKTNFRLIIYSHSSANPENLAKTGPVDFEIIGPTRIVKRK